jgi:hypothetical protein
MCRSVDSRNCLFLIQVMDCCYVSTDTQCATPGTCFKWVDDKCVVVGCVKGKLAATTWRFRVIHYFIAHCCAHMPAPLVDSSRSKSNLNPFYYCPSIYTLVTRQLFFFELFFRTYHNYYTYSMEQSLSWEANRFSASQKIPRILRNPKGHYPPPVPNLSQTDSVQYHIP